MNAAVWRAARRLAMGVLLVAWAAAAHYTTALAGASYWGAALGVAPFAFIAVGIAWRSPRRIGLLALLAGAVPGFVLAWPTLAQNVGWMYFIQHVGTNGLLCLAFGHTLLSGREAMCSRIARLIHGDLSATLARYTRQVTIAWALFFGLTAAASVALFAFAPIAAWSTFANLLTIPLVTMMFIGEYAVRLRVLPPTERGGILDAVRAYWQPARSLAPVRAADTFPSPAEP